MSANEPAVSVVVPVRNEAGNIALLVGEIAAALAGSRFEVVYVDDGSTDATEAELKQLMAQYPWLRRVHHKVSCGQSAAVRSGVAAARGSSHRYARRRRPERSAFCPGIAAGARNGRAARRPDRRATGRAQGERLQETAIAHRQCGARRGASRRHPRHRLRIKGVLSRRCSCGCLILTACTASCRRWSGAKASTSVMSTSSTARAPTASPITAFGTACGSAFSIWPACGG